MRDLIFGTLLVASTLAANAMSAPAQAQQVNPLVENVNWVRPFYYQLFVYVLVCGWVATLYGPARLCN